MKNCLIGTNLSTLEDVNLVQLSTARTPLRELFALGVQTISITAAIEQVGRCLCCIECCAFHSV